MQPTEGPSLSLSSLLSFGVAARGQRVRNPFIPSHASVRTPIQHTRTPQRGARQAALVLFVDNPVSLIYPVPGSPAPPAPISQSTIPCRGCRAPGRKPRAWQPFPPIFFFTYVYPIKTSHHDIHFNKPFFCLQNETPAPVMSYTYQRGVVAGAAWCERRRWEGGRSAPLDPSRA